MKDQKTNKSVVPKGLHNPEDQVQIGKYWINEKKFLSNLVENDDGCKIWSRGRHRQNYGMMAVYNAEKNIKQMNVTHRVAMMLHLGRELGRDEFVVHEFCDNQLCCNPDHMIVGTAHDRNRVQYAKGRRPESRKGKQNRAYKYPDDMMRFIRDNPTKVSAEKYGLEPGKVWYLKDRFKKGYKWL